MIKVVNDAHYGVGHLPREVRILQHLAPHPNVPPLVDWRALPATGTYAIVLKHYLEEKVTGAEPRKMQKYMWDLLSALVHCHERGIIYRDVKPGSFFFFLFFCFC